MKLLDVSNLNVSFYKDSNFHKVVEGVSFTIHKEEAVALVGESGSGKSVTAKALVHLLPPGLSKVEGHYAMFMGHDLLLTSNKEMRTILGKKIGFVFQDPMTFLDPVMKVGHQIEEGYKVHYPKLKREAKSKALELLELVRIRNPEETYNKYPFELSGGMRQRVMIAAALMTSPELLIADEPTTALDVTVQASIISLLKDLKKKLKMSVLLITHDLSIVASFCDRVLVMKDGHIVERNTTEKLFANPKVPYTQMLLNAIPANKLVDNTMQKKAVLISKTDNKSTDTCDFTYRIEKTEVPKWPIKKYASTH